MKPLDRALIAWSKGNFVGSLEGFYITREQVFYEGNPMCIRCYDNRGDPFILRREAYHDGLLPNPVTPRHLKGRKWYEVEVGQYSLIPAKLSLIQTYAEVAKREWRLLTMNEIYNAGEAIEELRKLFKARDMDIFVSSEEDEDLFVLGAKHLLRGRVGAITRRSENEWSYSLTDFKIHKEFAAGLLEKMKNDGVTLHDLEKAA